MQPLVTLALLLAPLAHANPEARVDVVGLGLVRLGHAQQTCTESKPVGTVTAAVGNPRVPAFQDVARGLLGLTPDARKAYFKFQGHLDWPTREIDVTYEPDVVWVPPAVVGSCQAAGAWWVKEGVRLYEICSASASDCKAEFDDDEWPVVKEALKEAKKNDGTGRDAFFAHLSAHEEALWHWSDPGPLLWAACDWPRVASSQNQFLDRNDLVAARRACLQMETLVTHAAAVPQVTQACDTPWRDVTDDAPHIVVAPATDVGVTSPYDRFQVESIRDRLTRMDPSPGSCVGDWAAVWRKQLVQMWRDAQQVRACDDGALATPDRLHLCPELPDRLATACDGGDGAACNALAELHLEGVGGLDGAGGEADEARAIALLLQACQGGHGESCDGLRGRLETITGWVDTRLAAASGPEGEGEGEAPQAGEVRKALDEARTLVADYGPFLQEGWLPSQAERVFDAAVAVKDPFLASAVLADFAGAMPPEWLEEAKGAIETLRE